LLGLEVKENRKESKKWLTLACEGHPDENVREYFESVRPRITEVIDEHSLDVALRSGARNNLYRLKAFSVYS
jgi:hypothetical protein